MNNEILKNPKIAIQVKAKSLMPNNSKKHRQYGCIVNPTKHLIRVPDQLHDVRHCYHLKSSDRVAKLSPELDFSPMDFMT